MVFFLSQLTFWLVRGMNEQRGLEPTPAPRQPGQCRQSRVPEKRSRDLPPAPGRKRKKGRKENGGMFGRRLSLGNGRFGAWNAGAAAAERLHPAPLPHRRRLCPAAALPSLKQNNHQKKTPTTTPPQLRQRKRRGRKREGLKMTTKKRGLKKFKEKKQEEKGGGKRREFSFSARLSNGYLIVGGLGGNRYLPLSGACKYFCHS